MIEKTSGKILRAIRKFYGINQVDFCQLIGVQQGTLSRLESNKLELSAYEWIKLCDVYQLDPNVLKTGKIESLEKIEINPTNAKIYGNFKLNKKYSQLMGSTVRTAYPFVRLLEKNIGTENTAKFLNELGIDKDYFVIQNLPISLKAIEDIFLFLSSKGLVTKNNFVNLFVNLFETTPISEIHKITLMALESKKSPESKFKKLTSIIAEHFEQNSEYTFEGEKSCFIKARDMNFISDLKLSDEFKLFRQIYNLEHINRLAPLFNSTVRFKSKAVEGGWDIFESDAD